MKLFYGLFFTVSASALFLATSAFAGTITFSGGATRTATLNGASLSTSPNNSPFTLSSFQYGTSSTAAKLYGDQLYSAAATGSEPRTITFTISGTASGQTGEQLFVPYDFTLVTSNGTVTPSVVASISIFGSQIASSTQSLASSTGTFHYTGKTNASSPVPAQANGVTVDFTGSFTLTWAGAVFGDTLRLTVPNNSIDFVLAPVPEPTSLALLGAAGLLAAFRRRR